MKKTHQTSVFIANPFILVYMAILLLAMILVCGCSIHQPDRSFPEAGMHTEAIVGTWVHDPGSADSPLFLYIFKDYSRFDAIALPRDAAIPLPYEEWVTGTWKIQGTMEYRLNGQVIRNDFITGSHSALPVIETLVYDPQNDILFNRAKPAGIYQRVSDEPLIPPGMILPIPWN